MKRKSLVCRSSLLQRNVFSLGAFSDRPEKPVSRLQAADSFTLSPAWYRKPSSHFRQLQVGSQQQFVGLGVRCSCKLSFIDLALRVLVVQWDFAMQSW
ncbi:hypothetical protein Pmani_038365 [Petrolisthes manimaculis]|uniref:Uncharacterized protein n=1 Tax=Petrolisthes manimaculis TaxID=1843537 RepID=A0AAE1NEU4_9EUCA|nr:hypothetical protein Pmani_038365 [Petrolisthes manimaculis]